MGAPVSVESVARWRKESSFLHLPVSQHQVSDHMIISHDRESQD